MLAFRLFVASGLLCLSLIVAITNRYALADVPVGDGRSAPFVLDRWTGVVWLSDTTPLWVREKKAAQRTRTLLTWVSLVAVIGTGAVSLGALLVAEQRRR